MTLLRIVAESMRDGDTHGQACNSCTFNAVKSVGFLLQSSPKSAVLNPRTVFLEESAGGYPYLYLTAQQKTHRLVDFHQSIFG